jgi:hypothetical protein
MDMRNHEGIGVHEKSTRPMAFAGSEGEDVSAFESATEELEWLMSLALDGCLDDHESQRLDMLLGDENDHAIRWSSWQALDQNLHNIPYAIPNPDFVDRFAMRLEIRERQRRLRTGFIFGFIAVALWLSAMVGLVTVGAFVWTNPGGLFNTMVDSTLYWWSAAGQLIGALANTFAALLSTPETLFAMVCYLVAVVAILSGWFVFLRRSTQMEPLTDAQMVEA